MNAPDWAEDIAFQVRMMAEPDVAANAELLAGLAHIAETVMAVVRDRRLSTAFSTSLSGT